MKEQSEKFTCFVKFFASLKILLGLDFNYRLYF